MSVTYSLGAINARLEGVVDYIDTGGNGSLVVRAGTTVLSTISLANPCGTVAGGVLTFDGTLLDPAAASTGDADNVVIYNGDGDLAVENLTVGIPLSGADVVMSNGLNSTLITAGQTVELISGQITGS